MHTHKVTKRAIKNKKNFYVNSVESTINGIDNSEGHVIINVV